MLLFLIRYVRLNPLASLLHFSSSYSVFTRSFCCSLPRPRVCLDFSEMVGHTPLVRLREASAATGCQILGKCEFMNPGGSVKDRPAISILDHADKQGLLGSCLVVEGTAGNTGIGLALAGNAKGYKTVCVVPDSQPQEKKDTLRACGAFLVEVPPQKVWHPDHFVKFSGRLAKHLGGFWAQQFDNKTNRLSHYKTTGPEIWYALEGVVDGFVSAVGTGGTLAGVSKYLKERNPRVQIALSDVPGAVLYRYYTTGELMAEGTSIVENIGQGRVTGNLEDFRPDHAFEIPDHESLPWVHTLHEKEGLTVGMTSGVNIAGAVRLARRLGPGKTIVTILCDSGHRYAKKQYNAGYLKSLNLPPPPWMDISWQEDQALPELREAVRAAAGSEEEIAMAVAEHEPSSVPGTLI